MAANTFLTLVLSMKRPLPPTLACLLPRLATGLAATLVLAQSVLPALADLNFKPTYNKVQIAAADTSIKNAPAPAALVAPAVATTVAANPLLR